MLKDYSRSENCMNRNSLELIAHEREKLLGSGRNKEILTQWIKFLKFSVQWAQSYKFQVLLGMKFFKLFFFFIALMKQKFKFCVNEKKNHANHVTNFSKKSSDITMTTSATLCLTSLIWNNIFSLEEFSNSRWKSCFSRNFLVFPKTHFLFFCFLMEKFALSEERKLFQVKFTMWKSCKVFERKTEIPHRKQTGFFCLFQSSALHQN